MNKARNIAGIFLLGWVLAMVYMYVSFNQHQLLEPVETEELWHKTVGDADNPFKKTKVEYAWTLDIKDGYVSYKYWFDADSATYSNKYSQSLSSFSRNFDKIK